MIPSLVCSGEKLVALSSFGGIVYTPRWIVREIVERTLGPRIHGKSPAQLIKIRVIDRHAAPARSCWAQRKRIFDAHLAWYTENAVKDGKVPPDHACRAPSGR